MADSDDTAGARDADDIIAAARRDYQRCVEAWRDNQHNAREDLRFARLGEQWPKDMVEARARDNRPCLTFNRMPAFIRQVVNDARQNKPAIKVHPQDSGADRRTAEILDGLIRNIETVSDADVAYDTAIEHAVGQGFGFWRINTRYTSDDAFDQDIVIERVANPFTIYGDPRSTAADSSDWNVAFVVTTMSRDEFRREYPKAEKVDWDRDFAACPDWLDGDNVTVAEYWTREKVRREIVALSDGAVVDAAAPAARPELYAGRRAVGRPREVESWQVTQRIMSGAELLRETRWAGKYIPIVPVYGDEVVGEDGRRHFRSLIRDARDAQAMVNYMRTTGIEGLALGPRVPFIGPKGAFDCDPNWQTANSESHPYLEYDDKGAPPQRQPLPPHFSAALQEAISAADDMKAIIGIYDASLGARSNETSGRAILARQREGDVSTFHFIDNLQRAIRHGGRILLDLIPKVYGTERIVRVLGEDMVPGNVRIAPASAGAGSPDSVGPGSAAGAGLEPVYDLTAGKYDLTVRAGPSFTSRREEAALEMREMMQALPSAIPLIGDLWAQQQDWPMADRIAERLRLMLPPPLQQPEEAGALPPEVERRLREMGQGLEAQAAEIARLQAALADKAEDRRLKARELDIKSYEAETERLELQRRVAGTAVE
jgi:hypothetical protein